MPLEQIHFPLNNRSSDINWLGIILVILLFSTIVYGGYQIMKAPETI